MRARHHSSTTQTDVRSSVYDGPTIMYRIANPFGERHFSGICAANWTVFRHRDRVVDHGPAGLDVDPLDERAEERLRLGDVAGAQELGQVGGDFSLVEQHAELDGTGPVTISQALATVAGRSNTVAFDYRARSGTGGATNGLSATWNGVEIAPGLTFTGAWQSHTAQVTGTGSDTLAISDTGTADGVGTFRDNVTVTALDSQPPVVTPVVSITGGSAITEGGTASFTITASPAPASSITVNIGVSQNGAFAASGAATVSVSFATTTHTISTADDSVDEADGSVTATLKDVSGYTISGSNGAATVNVADNDAAGGCRSARYRGG